VGAAYSTHGENNYKKLKTRHHMGNLGIDGRIILK
jgi:hypothetical protein